MTDKRSVRSCIPMFLCAALLCIPVIFQHSRQAAPVRADAGLLRDVASPASHSPQLKLNARAAVLIDGETGRTLYGKEEEVPLPMASTTKIMTCILALEKGNVEDVVEVSAYAAGQPKVHLGAPAGRRFRMGDLLYSLMLESHNDTAVMLAEYLAGDVKSFADMMNEKAREIGCEKTWFITPNGLDARERDSDGNEKIHSTTAGDLAAIMRYCTWQSPKSREFLAITQTQNYYFTDTEGKGGYSCVNHNALFAMMEGLLSGKTGFTGGAGYSYVASLEDDGRKYVIALLGCGWPPHKTYKWSDAKALFGYGLKEYHREELKEPPKLERIVVADGIARDDRLGHEAWTEGEAIRGEAPKILIRDGEQVEVRAEIPDRLTAPVHKGETIGEFLYILEGIEIYREPVYAAREIRRIDVWWCLGQVASRYLQ